MIIEGILTTQAEDGSMHVAPIGPHVDVELTRWVLKPYQTSQTFQHLRSQAQCVFHVVDDGLLMVQSVLGLCNPPYERPAAQHTPGVGWILTDAIRALPLSIREWDLTGERAIAHCDAGSWRVLREFWGWNRARHSLLELAVLASRREWTAHSELVSELDRHRIIIEKTAGDRELQALQLIEQAFDAAGRALPG